MVAGLRTACVHRSESGGIVDYDNARSRGKYATQMTSAGIWMAGSTAGLRLRSGQKGGQRSTCDV
jgi:hypothetical protein